MHLLQSFLSDAFHDIFLCMFHALPTIKWVPVLTYARTALNWLRSECALLFVALCRPWGSEVWFFVQVNRQSGQNLDHRPSGSLHLYFSFKTAAGNVGPDSTVFYWRIDRTVRVNISEKRSANRTLLAVSIPHHGSFIMNLVTKTSRSDFVQKVPSQMRWIENTALSILRMTTFDTLLASKNTLDRRQWPQDRLTNQDRNGALRPEHT